MKKVTVISPANIAFIKYWGQTAANIYIPRNNNISMTLSGCQTTTTIQRNSELKKDLIELSNGTAYTPLLQDTHKGKKAYEQIERIRQMSGSQDKVHIRSQNSFPSDAGIASSASGFSALTAALLLAFDQNETFDNKIEFSKEVRMCGSASAARSVYGGFVELLSGTSHDESYAIQIADENYWNLVDIVAVVNPDKKKTSSSEGHASVDSSPYYKTRLEEMKPRIKATRKAIKEKNIRKLGPAIEEDAISMHLVMMSSKPPAYYWEPGTIAVMKKVIEWRENDDLQAYFTMDAGANVHVICEKKDASEVEKRLKTIDFVQTTIYNEPGEGTHESDTHLF
jgi:diphosphomevalonate decarboxylase